MDNNLKSSDTELSNRSFSSGLKKILENTKASVRLFKFLCNKRFDKSQIDSMLQIDAKNKVIIEKMEKIKELEKICRTDFLTELYNKNGITELLKSELERSHRSSLPITVLAADIDYFKKFNDIFGHDVGDAVLKVFARTLKESVRETDYVGRSGGEEFTIICADTREKDKTTGERINKTAQLGAESVLKRLVDNVRNIDDSSLSFNMSEDVLKKLKTSQLKIKDIHGNIISFVDGKFVDKLGVEYNLSDKDISLNGSYKLMLTASFGAICFDEGTLSQEHNIDYVTKIADNALYKAKETGRNKFVLDKYEPQK